jgi:hypothetical protein
MFIQAIQGKCSRREEVRRLSDSWVSENGGASPGWLGGTYGFTDDDDFFAVVRFESREQAMENSQRPETDEFAKKMGELMDGEPSFFDSDQVETFLDGGSDDAKFVQVIRGKADPGLWQKLGDGSELREMRPEIIGGTVAIQDDGSFVETVAFTDEASARRGESEMTAQPPPEVGEALQGLMEGAEFYDLREVWFSSP